MLSSDLGTTTLTSINGTSFSLYFHIPFLRPVAELDLGGLCADGGGVRAHGREGVAVHAAHVDLLPVGVEAHHLQVLGAQVLAVAGRQRQLAAVGVHLAEDTGREEEPRALGGLVWLSSLLTYV